MQNPENFYPWAIQEQALHEFLGRINGYTPPPEGVRGATFMETIQARVEEALGLKLYKGGSIAVQPVSGVITAGAGPLEEYFFGAFDLNRIQAAADLIAANPSVKTLVLAINSPGGYTQGMTEATAALKGLTSLRPGFQTSAYAVNAYSCAYWLAASVNGIHAAPGAGLGSIGAYAVTMDSSAAYAAAGVQVRLHASGSYKGMFTPGVPVDPKWLEFVQARVDAVGSQFRSAVSAARPQLSPDAMQGQSWDGPYPEGIADSYSKFRTLTQYLDSLSTP